MTRLDRVRARAAEQGARAALISHLPHVRWATGFSGSNALLLVTEDGATLFTDGRYSEQAGQETDGRCDVVIASDLVAALAEHGGASGAVCVEAESLTVARLSKLSSAIDAEWIESEGLLSRDVASKDADQVEALRRAQALTCSVFEAIVPFVGPGVTELDLAAEITYQHLRRGASAMSFEPIVAAGPRGALPHARPSSRAFAPGDLVVIDMGGVVDGYCADLTRMISIGPPAPPQRAAVDAVTRALDAGIGAARAGVSGGEMDAAARDVLRDAGLEKYFTHSLGHGVGLEVHEWPRLSGQVEHRVLEGACVTVEPGVYVPGEFGVRIEDLVVVREGGAESLTPLSRDLVVV